MKLWKTNNAVKKIWIDMDNSPHVPFFRPIIDELKQRGFEVVVTARDCFQVCDLADLYGMDYIKVGRHYGKNKIKKIVGLIIRALQLMPIIIREKPDFAISHGSRSQMLLAWMLSIPTGLIMDYEYIKTFPFIHLDAVIAPQVIDGEALAKYNGQLHKYPGIKENVYTAQLHPDPSLRRRLGIDDDQVLVLLRPPANEAHYHNPKSEAYFEMVLNYLKNHENVRVVILPRNDRQKEFIVRKWTQQFESHLFIVPEHVEDGLNLIWNADVVISGGGTMNREAAALGVPVYSIFQGHLGGVDRYLNEQGRLHVLHDQSDLKEIRLMRRPSIQNESNGKLGTLHSIVDIIASVA